MPAPRLFLAALTLGAAALPALAEPAAHDVFGTFYTEAGTSRVPIKDCGDGSPCGRVSAINPNSLEEGVTPQDVRAKDGEPVLGLLILKGFEKKKNDWRGGTIYDPENDKTYDARIKRLDDGNLQLKGCVGPFCQTQVWPEYEGE